MQVRVSRPVRCNDGVSEEAPHFFQGRATAQQVGDIGVAQPVRLVVAGQPGSLGVTHHDVVAGPVGELSVHGGAIHSVGVGARNPVAEFMRRFRTR